MNAAGNSLFSNDLSTLQSQICEDPTDGFELGNNLFDPNTYPHQQYTNNAQTVPLARYFDSLSENSLTESPARYMQVIPGGPKTRVQLSVGAPLHTPGQNNLASADDESFVPTLVMGYPRFSPTLHPGNNPYGINIQHVINGEKSEKIHALNKTRKYLTGVPSPSLLENTWCYTSEESRATFTQCSPPSPLKIWWKLALQHLQGKELLVRCRNSAMI